MGWWGRRGRWGRGHGTGRRTGGKIIIKQSLLLLLQKKNKGCSQKYGNKKGVTSGSGNYLGKVGSYEKR